MLLQNIQPSTLVLPLTLGVAALLALLVIRQLLRRAGIRRGIGLAFLLGALALGGATAIGVLARQLDAPIDAGLRSALLAAIACCWGFAGLGLFEDLLIRRVARRGQAPPPRLALDIGRALAFVVVILLTLSLVLGVQISSVVISSTIISAVVGLALQDLLKNVFAGIALQAERPFDVGHWVEINRQIGRVVEMSWRATRVITTDGNYVIYPNSTLAQADLINYTLGSPIQAMHVQIGVDYRHPPNQVKRVLAEAALSSPDVCREPPPSVKLVQYGDYSVTYDVKFWLYNYDKYTEKRDAVMSAAWYHLRRSDIKLPFPIREVHLHNSDSLTSAEQQQGLVENVVATLRQVDLFAVLDAAELAALAAHVDLRLYAAGEALARQGETGGSFFIIRGGRVRIDVAGQDGGPAVTVNRLGPGEFFGELALLTGEPRGASVFAEEDTETLVVAQRDLAPILQANPELPERLGTVLEQRVAMNQMVLAIQVNAGADEPISRPTLVSRIRQLFGLD